MAAAPFSAVFFEGRFVSPGGDEARVPLTSRGYLLGDGVFETLRGYDGVCFRAERHLAYLARGAAMFGLRVPVEARRLLAVVHEAASRTGVRDAYVRVTLTRGEDEEHPLLSVISRPLVVPTDDAYANGVPSTIVSWRRLPPSCMDPTTKTTSYAPQVLAARQAASRGVGEGDGLMLSVDGRLACATMANVFVVEGDVLRTPSLSTGCRAGTTREAVLEVAQRAGLTPLEEDVDAGALFVADEVFLTSSRVECLPVDSIDGREIGRARRGDAPRHPRTAAIRAALRAMVAGEQTRATTPARSTA